MQAKDHPAVGWREWVALPELGVPWVKAKVDTGARSSSLHAYELRYRVVRGVERVRFLVHPFQRNDRHVLEAEATVLERRVVTSSSGHREERPVVQTLVELFGQRWPIELTLTNRDAMGFRMLVGRQAVRRRFVVDPGRSFLAGKPPKDVLPGRPRKKRAQAPQNEADPKQPPR